jgi:O-antigen/teichoic acid export membrane protein
MKKVIDIIISYFKNGDIRSLEAKKNIFALFTIKLFSLVLGLSLVPLTINYLNPTKYGIWITLSSVIGWFSFFDIGLGNGLRNKFTEAVSTGDNELAKVYVSTTYVMLSFIIGFILLFFILVNPYLEWNKILNVSGEVIKNEELSFLALVVFTFFCLSFIFKLIITILTADQKPAKASFIDFLGQLLSFILVYILINSFNESLFYLGFIISGVPVLVLFTANVFLFNGPYKVYRPSIRFFSFNKIKDLLNLGIKFFILQIAAIILYSTNNIIISQLFGPDKVTPYNVAFKYFSLLMMVFSIIVTPFWSAFTDAWINKEVLWITKIVKKLMVLWFFLVLVGVIMLLISNKVFFFWVGYDLNISFAMSGLILLWVIMNAWNGIFSQFLNGLGIVKLQMFIGITCALINIPISILFGRMMGIEGVLFANLIVSAFGVIIYPIQYFKIIQNRATGIWNK